MKQGFYVLAFVAAALPAMAHHSFPAQYDIDKPISLKAKVTKVEWTNPHIFIYADVTDASGAVVSSRLMGTTPTSRPWQRSAAQL